MSVVAACSLLKGIMLGADCRVTIRQPSKQDVYVDTCQKLYGIPPSTAIGFVGDLNTASGLLKPLFKELSRLCRKDGVSFLHWLPRFFRYTYSQLPFAGRSVGFLVGSSLVDRPNVISRTTAMKFARECVFESSVNSSWCPETIVKLLSIPQHISHVIVPDSYQNLLYSMHSPQFVPRLYEPLQCVAIGSGAAADEEIKGVQRMLVSDVGNDRMEVMWFRNGIQAYLRKNDELTVGGLFPIIRVDGQKLMFIGQSTMAIPKPTHHIELQVSNDGWVQKNCVTGKQIRLVHPWDVDVNAGAHNKFDDMRMGLFGSDHLH